MRFEHVGLSQRVCFGAGEAADVLTEEVRLLGATRVMVIAAGPERELVERITASLPVVLSHDEVAMHVPVEVVGRARAAAMDHDEVVASFEKTDNTRLKQLMQALTRHLHAYLREVRLTDAEWMRAIEFLTAAGNITDEKRQEFILLSDALGAC